MQTGDLSGLGISRLRQRIQCIGNTPMKRVDLVFRRGPARSVYLKDESHNPGGSVKDRTALSNITFLESRGVITPDSILVDSSSGNGACGYAWISAAKGYRFEAVIDPKATQENVAKIRSFGATTHLVTEMDEMEGYLQSRIRFCRALIDTDPRYVFLNQYDNPGNCIAHFKTTGPEILRDMNGHVDAVFVGASTGGTLTGIGRFLRVYSPTTRVIGVDAQGSIVFGGLPGKRLLTGIGASRASSFLTPDIYDAAVIVTDEEAFAFCRALQEKTGIGVGGSSGAVLAACARLLPQHPEWHNVVCLCPDGATNYASTIYNNQWLVEKGISLSSSLLGGVEDFIAYPPVIYN